MSGILASKAVAVMIAEENVWKRIFGLDAQTLFDTCTKGSVVSEKKSALEHNLSNS